MTVSVVDGHSRVTDGQALAGSLAISVIVGATVDGEVRSLVDKRSGLGIGTGVGGIPEGTTEVYPSESVGN